MIVDHTLELTFLIAMDMMVGGMEVLAREIIPEFTAAARIKLNTYDWPGNVRELDNVIQRALILMSNDVIDSVDLLIEKFDSQIVAEVTPPFTEREDKLGSELKLQEHQIILDTLTACKGSRKAVAEKLGISPRTLRYKIAKMRDFGIDIPVQYQAF